MRSLPTLMIALLLASGCASYVTPGSGVSLAAIDDAGIEEAYSRVPASSFPANLAIVRIQDAGYYSKSNHGYRLGRYSVITVRDIESEDSIALISQLPMVRGVAPLSRILLPPKASSIRDLRVPAAQLQADLLLIYSVDTAFTVDGRSLGPLSTISLGLIPNKKAHVTATVAGVLVDVRTGFIYGSTEATVVEHQRANMWSTGTATDAARLRAEKKAFEDFVGDFSTMWSGVVSVHAG